ncbi:MAG: roadblock/LC7 domain-containing protein [Euryarchaeota archaeon]|nr:roadblock/LC7 domain-containing protein [Euryarchaeota archaeon]
MPEAVAGEGRPLSPSEELEEELAKILADLQSAVPGILGTILNTDEGHVVAANLKGGAETGPAAIVGSLVAKASERCVALMDFGTPMNTVITTDSGSICVFAVDDVTTLTVLLQPHTNSILVLVEARKAVERIRKAITPGV